MTPAPDFAALLRAHGVSPGARVLLLAAGAARAPLAGALAGDGYVVDAPTSLDPLGAPAAPFAAAVIAGGALESHEWDRWLVQQAVDALAPGGVIVLETRNLWSLATPADAAWLAGRIAGEVGARVGRALRPGSRPDPSTRFRGRRHPATRLSAWLERFGLAPLAFDALGPGWLAPLAVLPATRRHWGRWRVVARREERGVAGGSLPLPDCAAHLPAFEQAHAGFVAAREAWRAAHGDPGVRELDPAAARGRGVVVLAPHPDDEVIGCGGTLLAMKAAGARVVCVQATDGSDGWALRHEADEVRRAIRLAEARAVAARAGFDRLDEWRADNRAFRHDEAWVARLAALLVEERPRFVFTTFLADLHADHRLLNRILAGAILRVPDAVADTTVLGYEVWSLAPPGLVCDVTAQRAAQEALLALYPTAMKVDDFVEMCEARNYYNACRYLRRSGYAEAFHALPARDYPALLHQAWPTSSV